MVVTGRQYDDFDDWSRLHTVNHYRDYVPPNL